MNLGDAQYTELRTGNLGDTLKTQSWEPRGYTQSWEPEGYTQSSELRTWGIHSEPLIIII